MVTLHPEITPRHELKTKLSFFTSFYEKSSNQTWENQQISIILHTQEIIISIADSEDIAVGVRLVSTLPFMGRVEVPLPDNDWGTICGDGWTTEDAMVVCRQLNFRLGWVRAKRKHEFGYGAGPVTLSKVILPLYEKVFGQLKNSKLLLKRYLRYERSCNILRLFW